MAAIKLPPDHFGKIAQKIANADSRLYDELMAALYVFADEVTVAVTEAPPDQILICQGRAQIARKFVKLFEERKTP